MLTWQELVELEQSLPQEKVLSIYLDGASRDPAERTAWRRVLRGALARTRESLRDASHAERDAFDRCAARVDAELGAEERALGSPGWMGFFTASGMRHAARLPSRVTPQVTWGDRLAIAPALSAAVSHPVASLGLVDARSARLFRLTGDALEPVDTLRAEAHLAPADHMGYPPRLGFHTGTRGIAGTDESQRELRAATDAMLREAAHRLETLAGRAGVILLGGIGETVEKLERLLLERSSGRERPHRISGVTVHATPAQLGAMAIEERSIAEQEGALRRVLDVIARAAAHGKGSAGLASTREALRERAVERLMLTPRFVAEHAEEAEAMLREALAQSAAVEVVAGAAAGRLDAEAGGTAARLRFVPPADTATATAAAAATATTAATARATAG